MSPQAAFFRPGCDEQSELGCPEGFESIGFPDLLSGAVQFRMRLSGRLAYLDGVAVVGRWWEIVVISSVALNEWGSCCGDGSRLVWTDRDRATLVSGSDVVENWFLKTKDKNTSEIAFCCCFHSG